MQFLNPQNQGILNYVFDNSAYTEEQKAVMIHSLTYALEKGQITQVNAGFFLDIMHKAGFEFKVDQFQSIAEQVNKSSDYMFEVLRSLNEDQKEKYAMLCLLVVDNCYRHNVIAAHTHEIIEHTLGGIGVFKNDFGPIAKKMLNIAAR